MKRAILTLAALAMIASFVFTFATELAQMEEDQIENERLAEQAEREGRTLKDTPAPWDS